MVQPWWTSWWAATKLGATEFEGVHFEGPLNNTQWPLDVSREAKHKHVAGT